MKKGKVILIIVVVFLAIGVISGLIHNLTGTTPEVADNSAEIETEESAPEAVVVTEFLTPPDFTAEQNSSEMVDLIAETARNNSASMTDDQASEIINAIREADHNFFNGPEEMEKYMWYGYLLDYKYDDSDPRSSLGTDLCQAIKYVYRNTELVTDDSTHENLLQIDKDLDQIQ